MQDRRRRILKNRSAAALLAGLAWAALSWGAGPPPADVAVRVGESAACGEGLTVKFEEVLQDSRCPQGVSCVWSGNARVALTFALSGGKPERVELNTNLEPRSLDVLGYTVQLVSLSPVPKIHEKTDAKSYTATLKISRRTR